jgi:hypothetical protein
MKETKEIKEKAKQEKKKDWQKEGKRKERNG